VTSSIPLVSVIVPSYNYLKYLDKCLESVINQDYPNIELIVVDDGSTDGSLEYLLGFGGAIKVLQQENQGVSVARNFGILESKGEFIAFLDADDFWDTSKISKQVNIALGAGVDLVYSGVTLVAPDGVTFTGTTNPQFYGDCATYFRRYPTRAIVTLGTSNALIRRTILAKSGILDPKLSISADWDFFRRYCDYGEVAALNEQLTFYRQHPENMSTYSNAFIPDTIRSVRKMLTDDLHKSSHWARFIICFRTAILLTKYRIKKFKEST
jgi:glycosyltransferase involved in cell wall biosynthesis